jgi:hypothetical protein
VLEYKKYLVDLAKIVVSIPAYGRSYTLADPGLHQLGSKANASGAPGPYTRISGWLSFNEVRFYLYILQNFVVDYLFPTDKIQKKCF